MHTSIRTGRGSLRDIPANAKTIAPARVSVRISSGANLASSVHLYLMSLIAPAAVGSLVNASAQFA